MQTARNRGAEPSGQTDRDRITVRRIANNAGEIFIYGTIGRNPYTGEGQTGTDFVRDLNSLGSVSRLDVRISSEGGNIKDAWEIYNALNRHPATVAVFIDGLAASCASWIAQVGDSITMAENGQQMIHMPRSGCMGDAEEFIKEAEILNRMAVSIAGIYAARSGKSIAEWLTAMKRETWYTARESVESGLATAIAPNKGRVNQSLSLQRSRYEHRRRHLDLMSKE